MLNVEQQYGSARYTASTGSTTSDTMSGAGGSSTTSGVRRLRLSRPAAGHYSSRAPFGFTLRGGREHGTGFFVTHVEPGSEAYNQGLKVGDQVIRVNGYRLSDALHKEMLSLIASLNYLKLKVRNVGMVPVKEKPQDPLTWRLVAEAPSSPLVLRHSPPLTSKTDGVRDIKLTLIVPSKAKLGCGICKGPDWKPGIFIQFTKECGIAREAGLRPGDQIMQCNGIDFREINFNDAVNVMKQSRRLELCVRTGSGLDLFPGESSGYNSSASSATGDQSPSSTEPKRLSIVKEESMDLEDRLSQLDKNRYRMRSSEERNCKWDRESNNTDGDIEYNETSEQRLKQNRTIINLSEKGTTIQNSYSVTTIDSEKILNGHRSATPVVMNDKKTVVVDVHRSEEEYRSDKDNVTNITCHIEETQTVRKVSASSVVSVANSTTSSLSSAITQELQKRAERMKTTSSTISQIEESRKSKVLKDVDDEKKLQHDALMDEFKKAHRRMFAKSGGEDPGRPGGDGDRTNRSSVFSELDKETTRSTGSTMIFAPNDQPFNAYNGTRTIGGKSQNGTKTPTEANSSVTQENGHTKENGVKTNGHVTNGVKINGNVEHDHKVNGSSEEVTKKPLTRTGNVPVKNGVTTNGVATNGVATNGVTSKGVTTNGVTTNGVTSNGVQRKAFKPPGQPPPPPPMPDQNKNKQEFSNGVTNHNKPKAPPPPPIKKVQNGIAKSENIPERPPSTPTPDYDTSSLIKVISKPKLIKTTSDIVEMESLESFKLTNPSSPTPKPPNTYFMKQPTGTLTMKKATTPLVSVTIGEYPTNTFRKQPNKLEFLNNNNNEDQVDGRKDESVGSRLQSELAQTLSRSNLKKKTENDIVSIGDIYKSDNVSTFDSTMPSTVEPNANFYKRYGQNILPQPPSINIPKINLGKSLSHNNDNKIKIKTSFMEKHELAKTESLPQGGILKHSATPAFLNDTSYKMSAQQKTIKFGQTPTVIGDAEFTMPVHY